MSARPLEEWADLMYHPSEHIAHVVPFSSNGVNGISLCGIVPIASGWWGSGAWDEIENAKRRPLCHECAARVPAALDQYLETP